MTRKNDVDRLYATVFERYGSVDVSVQNAGVITISRLEQLGEEEWDRIIAVNTKGVFLCCQAAAAYMRENGWGRLINTASGQAREGFIFTPHYAASKMGVVGITHSLAKELAATGSRSTPSAPASSIPGCGPTTTRPGERCSATTGRAS